MPVRCCIVSCTTKRSTEADTGFFRIPAVITDQDKEIQQLSEKRRHLWLAAIKRKDTNYKKVEHWRVCSRHFISGLPASLLDELNPDWVPSVDLGYEFYDHHHITSSVERYERSRKRKWVADENNNSSSNLTQLSYNQSSDSDLVSDCDDGTPGLVMPLGNLCLGAQNFASGIAASSSFSKENDNPLIGENRRLSAENERLRHKISSLEKCLDQYRKMDESDFKEDKKVTFYTGLSSSITLMALFNLISPGLSDRKNSKLTKFQKFIVTLMRLRCNLMIQDLAYRFGVSITTISRAFAEVIDLLYVNLLDLIVWPNRDDLIKTMPLCFREEFGKKVTVIIDCFEIFIERPSNLVARAQTWSSYKHKNTAKYLIGITPQGSVSFISPGWGGRASDKYITSNSNFVNKLLPGDLILADRGFDILEVVAIHGAELNLPAFTRGKPQLIGKEVDESRKIAHVRIHVERVIGEIRQKYTMLESTIPITLLMTTPNHSISTLDKIVTVACALTNLCPSVVPFE